MKELQYLIVEDHDVSKFTKDVAAYVYEGWQLHGGLVVYMDLVNQEPVYCQAITRFV
jgi:hypothetical protein